MSFAAALCSFMQLALLALDAWQVSKVLTCEVRLANLTTRS